MNKIALFKGETRATPQVGDVVSDGLVTGMVVGEGMLAKVPVWKIATAPGKTAFIGKNDRDLKVLASKVTPQ